jgi:sigma-E factor negative regulatory protein RseB
VYTATLKHSTVSTLPARAASLAASACLLISTALSSVLTTAHAGNFSSESTVSPATLITEMSSALQTLNYEGSFVHLQGGNVEAMSILHSSDEGGELERMLSLNGEAREVFRNHSLVTCIWPDTNAVIVSDSKSRNVLPKVDASLANSEAYLLSMGKPDRVAGVETYVVNIQPRDQYRYGYKFWIDKDTRMLLRSMLIDENMQAVEQVMFTSISYPESIDRSRFKLPAKHTDIIVESTNKYKATIKPQADDPFAVNRVEFSSLPVGYEEVSETYKPMPINDGPISHVMVSDGMASVSVYVEYVDQASQKEMVLGRSSMGGMNAYTLSLPNALITAVGEVPPSTVESIANSVQFVQ